MRTMKADPIVGPEVWLGAAGAIDKVSDLAIIDPP